MDVPYIRRGRDSTYQTKNDQQDVNEPCVSPDGKMLYYSEDVYPGGYFQYNKDPNSEIFVIQSYNFETGEIKRVTGGPGGAFRPQVSNKGDKLAYVRRIEENQFSSSMNSAQEENGRSLTALAKISRKRGPFSASIPDMTGHRMIKISLSGPKVR